MRDDHSKVGDLVAQLLIFDLDGTLVDSVPDIATAVNAMLSDLAQQTVSTDTVRDWVGNGSYKLVERALVACALPLSELPAAHERFLSHYAEATCVDTVPYADVDRGLHQLAQAGYQLALVTNKPIRYVPEILTAFGWQSLFAVVLGGDSLSVKKPDPTPLLYVCTQLGVEPTQAVMIGDSKNDILAGQNAGMATLALSYGYNYGEDVRTFAPTAAFDRFDELLAYLL